MKNSFESNNIYKCLTLVIGLSFYAHFANATGCPTLEGKYNCISTKGQSKDFVGDIEIKQSVNNKGSVVYNLPYNESNADNTTYKKIADGVARTEMQNSYIGNFPVTMQTKCVSNAKLVDSISAELTMVDDDDKPIKVPLNYKTTYTLSGKTKALKVVESSTFGNEVTGSVSVCTKK